MNDNCELANELEDQIYNLYKKMETKLVRIKNKEIKKWNERADYEGIIVLKIHNGPATASIDHAHKTAKHNDA